MKNPFKNNSLASCLLGIIIGAGGYAGISFLGDVFTQEKTEGFKTTFMDNTNNKSDTNYSNIPEDPNGDCIITPKGQKFHNPFGCSSLKNSKSIRRVSSDDAIAAGLTPCSKCM